MNPFQLYWEEWPLPVYIPGVTGKLGVVAVGKLGVVDLLRVPTFVGEPSGSKGCIPGPIGLKLKRSSSTVREVFGVVA